MAVNSQSFLHNIDAQLKKLRSVQGLAEDAAPEVSKALLAEIKTNIVSQRDPWHRAWKPGQAGKPVLTGAGDKVTVDVVDRTVIRIRLNGEIEVRHHIGSARGYHGGSGKLGGFRRNIIPTSGKVPGPMRIIVSHVLADRVRS